jgi:hypothetical protein
MLNNRPFSPFRLKDQFVHCSPPRSVRHGSRSLDLHRGTRTALSRRIQRQKYLAPAHFTTAPVEEDPIIIAVQYFISESSLHAQVTCQHLHLINLHNLESQPSRAATMG